MSTQQLLIAGACLFGLSASAQPVLQNNVFPDLGDHITTVFGDTAGISPGSPGANQNWDFSNLQVAPPMDIVGAMTMVNAANTPYAADFPFANLCGVIFSDPDTFYFYYRKDPSYLFNIGSAATYGVILMYSDPETLLKTPLNFGENFTDDFSRYNTFPDNQLSGSAHKTSTYDAYGTLKMPLGTFQNAMRLRSVTAYHDTTILFAGYSINDHTDVTYEWFVPNHPFPQVSIAYSTGTTMIFFPGQPPNTVTNTPTKTVRFVNGLTTGTDAPAGRLTGITAISLWPNPANEVLRVRFLSERDGLPLQAMLLDAGGRVVRELRFETLEGPNSAEFPVADLPAGAYLLQLSDGISSRSLNWQKF